jgi:hypothetical protein
LRERRTREVFILPDMRFPNEGRFVLALGGVTIHVLREVEDAKVGGIKEHASEIMMDKWAYDMEVHNNGSIEVLRTCAALTASQINKLHPRR